MNNQKGFVVEGALVISLLIGAVLLFVPNPISSSIGVGIRPNKSVKTEASTQTIVPVTADGETLYHKDGSVAMMSQTVYKHEDLDIQQHVSLLEQLRSLPILLIVLVVLGGFSPFIAGILAFLWSKTKAAFKDLTGTHEAVMDDATKIVRGLDAALLTIPITLAGESLPGEIDRIALAKRITDKILNTLSTNYDQSTKDLVRVLRA